MATIEKSVDTMVNKLTKRSVVFNKKLAKITKPKKGSRKTKGKWGKLPSAKADGFVPDRRS
jgi:hypothetical protein